MKIPTDPLKRTLLTACALILLSAVLKWSLPLLKVLIACAVALIAWHFAGESRENGRRTDSFHGISELREENGIQIRRHVFSSASLDLTDTDCLPGKIELQSAFSSLSVRLPVDANITIHASGAFCSISLPGQKNVIFGENTVRCGSQDPSAPRLYLDLSCAFASATLSMG